jgi:two-component system chemotaxis response regulator CheY
MFDLSTRILVVDDMLTMRKLVMKSCKDVGFTDFIEAADGAKAWEALTNSNPPVGIIISDWNMPNSSGIDFLKRVRSESRYKALPFLLVTAEAEGHQVVEAVKAGVTEYLIKPFTRDSLETKLKNAYKKIKGA